MFSPQRNDAWDDICIIYSDLIIPQWCIDDHYPINAYDNYVSIENNITEIVQLKSIGKII
jgi:hypothetical protein